MQGKSTQEQAVDAYFFYIRVVLFVIFLGAYVMGVVNRKDPAVHSRYMLGTGLTLIDPVFHRIAQRAMGGADLNYQLLTFGLPCVILMFLMVVARDSPRGMRPLGAVLAAFVVGGVPLALDFYKWDAAWTWWKSVARHFVALPLT
jgi:hypothetical protein